MAVRTKATIIIAAGILAIVIVVGGFFWLSRGEKISESAPAPKAVIDNSAAAVKIAPPTPAEKQAASAAAVAKTFVERFGSFSNQSGYVSIAELTPLATATFAGWLQSSYLPKLKKEHDPAGYYYEISTEAPVIKPIEQSADHAKFLITAQRIEKTDNAENTFPQDIVLEMKNVGGEWLVDGAYWQSKK